MLAQVQVLVTQGSQAPLGDGLGRAGRGEAERVRAGGDISRGSASTNEKHEKIVWWGAERHWEIKAVCFGNTELIARYQEGNRWRHMPGVLGRHAGIRAAAGGRPSPWGSMGPGAADMRGAPTRLGVRGPPCPGQRCAGSALLTPPPCPTQARGPRTSVLGGRGAPPRSYAAPSGARAAL